MTGDSEFNSHSGYQIKFGRPENRSWAKKLYLSEVISVAAAISITAVSIWATAKLIAEPAKKDVPGHPVLTVGRQLYDEKVHYEDVNPEDQAWLMQSRQMRAAYESSVMIVTFDMHGHWHTQGSGTILKDTSVNGLPVILTVGHVLNSFVDGRLGMTTVAVDHAGHFLAFVKPVQAIAEIKAQRTDGPALLEFDRSSGMINLERISAIPGVPVAHHLYQAPEVAAFGGMTGGTGICPGDSGGGVFVIEDHQVRIAGVMTDYISGPEVYDHVESKVATPVMYGQGDAKDGVQYGRLIDRDTGVISSLGEHGFTAALKAVSTKPLDVEVSAQDRKTPFVAFGFGYAISAYLSGVKLENRISARLATDVEKKCFVGAKRSDFDLVGTMINNLEYHLNPGAQKIVEQRLSLDLGM